MMIQRLAMPTFGATMPKRGTPQDQADLQTATDAFSLLGRSGLKSMGIDVTTAGAVFEKYKDRLPELKAKLQEVGTNPPVFHGD
jgi:hypothetical protein